MKMLFEWCKVSWQKRIQVFIWGETKSLVICETVWVYFVILMFVLAFFFDTWGTLKCLFDIINEGRIDGIGLFKIMDIFRLMLEFMKNPIQILDVLQKVCLTFKSEPLSNYSFSIWIIDFWVRHVGLCDMNEKLRSPGNFQESKTFRYYSSLVRIRNLDLWRILLRIGA